MAPICTARIAMALALALALFCSGPAPAQTQGEPVQTEGAIEVGEAAVSDGEIRERIEMLLSQIDDYGNVGVAVTGGVVTLSGEVLDNRVQDELTAIVNRVTGVVAIENNTDISASLEERLEPAVDRIVGRGRNILANAPIFLVALGVLLAISIFGWFVTSRAGIWHRLAPNSFIADVYRAVARILFVVLGIVVALDILNATALLGAVLGAAGVVGLALGFAVRDTVENFIASILLSLRQPFRPNDFVEIDGDTGSVARLTSRATILISAEGNHIRIPNATVFKGRIVNYTRDPQRRFDFDLGVDAECDLAAALATATNAINALPFVLRDPEVSAWVKEVGDSNVILTFTGWVNQRETNFLKARGEAIRIAKNALEAAGFGLPEPIYRLRVDDRSRLGALTKKTAPTPQPAPPRPKADTPLPSAADPERTEDATEDAIARERSATDTGEDLLSEERQAE